MLQSCLKPSYSLRRQLLLSFGSTAFLTLVVVATVAAICTRIAGNTVSSRADDLLREQVRRRVVRNSHYVSETLMVYMNSLDKAVQLVTEIVQDRIVGYPEAGWEEDYYVPFFDRESARNKYPLNSSLLPMDWDIDMNINSENIEEHLPERAAWAKDTASFFSSRPSYFMQGVCDPSATNAIDLTYYENCTSANNDYVTGGVIAPTTTSKGLYEKAADIGILLKPIFEAVPDVASMGVYFYNSGAGSIVEYPGNNFPTTGQPYNSTGCEWMREINPLSGKPYGTDDDVARCHPVGTLVNRREYNAMERPWCREMALNPWHDPFDVIGTPTDHPIITIGRGVFDRRTGNFIGCVGLHVAVAALTAILHKSRIHEESDLSIVRYDDNTVFADTIADTNTFANVTETGLLSMENLEKLRHTVDYSSNLTHAEIMEALEKNVVLGSTAMYTVHPLPLPPKNYDPSYEPKFLVIHAISNNVFAKSEHIKNEIEDDVQWISLESFAIAAIGLALIFVVLWFVSRALTQPLLWMERVAWGIVNHADERSINSMTLADYGEPIATGLCVPSTEISELVREFGSMIKGFSGDGSATVAHGVFYEIRNQFTWQSDYQQIYSLSSSATDKKSVRWSPSADEDEDVLGESTVGEKDVVAVESNQEPHAAVVVPIVPAPPKQNLGVNILRVSKDIEFEKGLRDQFAGRKLRPYRSSLFWWILLLIVVPLVLTNAVICWIVSFQILEKVSHWIHDTADESLKLELAALHSVAVLKSTQAQLTINEVVRDLHVMTRLAGWLFFDGIARSDAFTHMEEKAAQECRGYVADDSTRICPFFNDFERAPCACEWEDLNAVACTDVNYTDARTLQERFFVCQAQDYDKVTGNRDDASSFGPGVQDSPNTTLWWDDVDKVPGAEKGRSASGFETTYDRIRVSSAISVVEIPIYNYVTSSNYSKYALSTYIAFQADGMVTGYHGCDHKQAFVSTFESNESNGAFKIAPKLCPKGKFGFDPRCREWYSTGHSLYNKSGQPVFITAPYLLATPTTQKNQFAATATSPIANPATGLYVGQTLLDFCPGSLRQLFESLSEPIAFLITPDDDEFGGDTVIGPGDFDRWESVPIGDRLFKFERPASVNQAAFETGPLKRLKNGESGIVKFVRTTEDGSMELLRLAFEPVNVTVLLALDPSDLSRGVNATSVLVYSVGVADREDEIQQPWKKTEDNIYSDLDRLRLIYLTVIVTVSALFIMCACNIAVKVTKPMITLLTVVQTINAGEVEDDIPPLHGGSREVHQVYNSFAKLYKIVRISNVAFFSGNLSWAYSFICDALKLFRKVGDEKAIGIACNNLGNTLHAMCSDARYIGECCSILPGICMLKTAHEHYNEAIDIAQRQLEKAMNDDEKADFAQQLADRLFNRGLFLLLVANDKCAPVNARQLALSDIAKVRQLDYDVRDFWLEHKLLLKRSAEYFYRLIRRTLGLLDFYSDDEVRAIWDAAELVEDADRFLFTAWDQPSAPLFASFSRIGRLQQLEGLAMLIDLRKGRTIDAARLAMRIFVEDEYIIECVYMMAAKSLLTVIRDDDWSNAWTSKTKSSVRADLRKMLKTCKQTNLDVGKCLIVALEISEKWESDPLLESINGNLLKLYDDCCLNDDHMGLVANTTQGDLNVPLGLKSDNEGLQRTSLDLATSSANSLDRPSFPYAIQMLIDSEASTESDSFLLLLTDGSAWDSSANAPLKAQIDRMNKGRETMVHVFILGMGIEAADVKKECKMMCTVTKKSLYIDIDAANVDSAFDDISAVIRGCQIRNVCTQGMMMEKF